MIVVMCLQKLLCLLEKTPPPVWIPPICDMTPPPLLCPVELVVYFKTIIILSYIFISLSFPCHPAIFLYL